MNIKNIRISKNTVFYKDASCNYEYQKELKDFAANLYARNLNPIFSAEKGKWYYIQECFIKEASKLVSFDEIGFYNSNKTDKQKESINKLVTILFDCIARAGKIPRTKSCSVALFDKGLFIGCIEFIKEGSTSFKKHFLTYSKKCELTFFQAFATKERLGAKDARIISKNEALKFYKY